MAASLLISTGCSPLQVWMGRRTPLDKTPITTVGMTLNQGLGMAPGDKWPLVVAATKPDGTTLRTDGDGAGRLYWEDLQIKATVVTVGAKGIVTLPEDPRLSDGQAPHLSITVPSHPDLKAELDIPLHYDRAFVSDFSGRLGNRGLDGVNGADGATGSYGSTNLDNPAPGGRGGDGGNGSAGQDGQPGEDAPALLVRVALRPGARPLLQVRVSGANRVDYYLVDPQGGTLNIKAEGGEGGIGGKGGRGGSGGQGGMGTPYGLSGTDGQGSGDGRNGPAGKPGTITVIYDPQAKPFLAAITFFNRDGSQGSGPLPIFKEASLAPLW